MVNTKFVSTTQTPLDEEVHIKMFSNEEELAREDEANDLKLKSTVTKVVQRGGKAYNRDSNSVIILDSGTEWTVVDGDD